MDLLEQYKQQRPEAFREQKQAPTADKYGRTYGGMTALVIRMSGGRIQDARGAMRVLLIAAVVTLLLSLLFFYGIPGFSSSPKAFVPTGYSPDALPR
ncbi:MAG: hypothetical protein AAB916_01480 [Patescibacteria group bacterium]